MTQKAKDDVEESLDMIEELERDIDKLTDEMEDAVDDLEDKWGEIASGVAEFPVSPYKKKIFWWRCLA